MLAYLGRQLSKRKSQLFCVACCRRIWPLLDEVEQRTVEELEQAAEGWLSGLPSLYRLAWTRVEAVGRFLLPRIPPRTIPLPFVSVSSQNRRGAVE